MKRTLILLLLFIGLGSGSYFMLKNQDTKTATSKTEDGDFAVKNVDDIYKIFIANKDGYRVLLERKKDHWLYNGKFKAREYSIGDLLKTISSIEMKYTTPRGAEKNMIKDSRNFKCISMSKLEKSICHEKIKMPKAKSPKPAKSQSPKAQRRSPGREAQSQRQKPNVRRPTPKGLRQNPKRGNPKRDKPNAKSPALKAQRQKPSETRECEMKIDSRNFKNISI